MMFDKRLVLAMFLFLIFITISSVCAGDANQTCDNVTGTYNDLVSDIQGIHSGDVYNVTRDYEFDSHSVTMIVQDRIIEIRQDDIVINGNGFRIDAGGSQNFAIFKVTGNNVTINNLTFANSEPGSIPGPTFYDNCHYVKINSPVCWQGDNGVMKNCIFCNDCSVNGGAVTWMGNNGIIDNCIFINNTARGAGGALYIGGAKNTISRCVFISSSSQLSGEAVYVDRNRKNISVLENVFTNELPVIDGFLFDIDVNYLFYSCKIPVWGDFYTSEAYNLDVVPLIYKAIMNGGVNNITCNFNYFAQYLNETGDFILSFVAYGEFSESVYHFGLDYLKSVCFSNITDFNQVFDCLIHGKYEFSLTQNLVCFVNDAEDYATYSGVESRGFWFSADKNAKDFTTNLKLFFTDNIDVFSVGSWNPKKMGFNSIVIMGNGSTVYGGAKDDRDEKKWVQMDDECTVMAYDLTIINFNTAVECLAGECYFNNVHFDSNRMNYYVDRDWGAAILNTGAVVCENCIFTNNYAKNGGAIFNQGYLVLNNCTFVGNDAYGKGDNVCNANGGVAFFDGKEIKQSTKYVTCVESISSGWQTLIKISAISLSFVVGFAAGYITANPIIGMAVGGLVGASLGLGSSSIIIAFSYDAKMDRLGLTTRMTLCSMAVGMLGGVLGSAVSPYGSAQFAEEFGVNGAAEGNPEVVEFINEPMEVNQGFIGQESAISEFSDIASNSGSVLSNVAESASEIGSVIGDISFITV